MDFISQLNKNELIRGLLKIKFLKAKVYEVCQKEEQIKNSLKNKLFLKDFFKKDFCIWISLVQFHQILMTVPIHIPLNSRLVLLTFSRKTSYKPSSKDSHCHQNTVDY